MRQAGPCRSSKVPLLNAQGKKQNYSRQTELLTVEPGIYAPCEAVGYLI